MKILSKSLLLFIATASLLLVSCQNRPQAPAQPATDDSTSVSKTDNTVADSTIYGEAGDFGMSTFCIITDCGDTLLMDRTAADGTDGVIYGDAQPGDRYSLITTDGRQSLKCAINLTELERFTKKYKIVNGQLMLTSEGTPRKAEIEWLDEDSLVLKLQDGTNKTVKMLPEK